MFNVILGVFLSSCDPLSPGSPTQTPKARQDHGLTRGASEQLLLAQVAIWKLHRQTSWPSHQSCQLPAGVWPSSWGTLRAQINHADARRLSGSCHQKGSTGDCQDPLQWQENSSDLGTSQEVAVHSCGEACSPVCLQKSSGHQSWAGGFFRAEVVLAPALSHWRAIVVGRGLHREVEEQLGGERRLLSAMMGQENLEQGSAPESSLGS